MAKTIMTVDDSSSVRQMVSFALQDAGYAVVEAEDGQEAMQKLQGDIAMIITDLNMPKMDGIELIQNVRQTAGYKFIPIVMLTTESQDEKKQQGKKAGASGWIVKPFKPPQLLSVIQKLLK